MQFTTVGPNVVEGRELNAPQGVALDLSVTPPILYIADTGNNRVLAFKYGTQTTPGAPVADLVLGQSIYNSNVCGGAFDCVSWLNPAAFAQPAGNGQPEQLLHHG